MEAIDAYIEENKANETASQIEDLKTTSRNFIEQIGALEEKVKLKEEAQSVLSKARDTINPTELSKLTSYIYLEEGFFGLTDVFPKIVNALVQAVFFLIKVIYCLVIIVLEQVFNANVYETLDSIVAFSAKFFGRFMEEYQYFVYALAIVGAGIHYAKTRRFSFRIFYFVVVWFVALWLYQPTTSTVNFGSQDFTANYNLSRIVKAVDGIASDVTRIAIAGFDELDSNSQNIGQSTNEENFKAVKKSIFDKIVYEPFLSLNFTTTDIPDEKVLKLFETAGKNSDVKDFAEAEENKKIAQLSWSSIGVKFLTAIASLVKACVIGLALILIGLISIVFKYLALIIIVALVIILFISMIPGFEQTLSNAGKKLIQFVFIGGLGLFFIRAFLFVDGLIEGAVGGMTKVYFWSAILQGIIWYVIWRTRSIFLTLFVKGTLSAQEVGQRFQRDLENFSPSNLPLSTNFFTPSRFLNRTSPHTTELGEDLLPPSNSSPRGNTLLRASKNMFSKGLSRVQEEYDTFRYGEGDTLDKELAHERREAFKQQLLDKKEDFKDFVRVPKMESLRSKLHDLAGDKGTPVQERYKERERNRLERQERRENREQTEREFKEFRRQSEGANRGIVPSQSELRRQFQMEKRLKQSENLRDESVDTPIESSDKPISSPIIEDDTSIAKELFKKGNP